MSDVSDDNRDDAYDAFRSHTLLTGRMHSLIEKTRYFENAVYNLGATRRSASVNGEFWDHYPSPQGRISESGDPVTR